MQQIIEPLLPPRAGISHIGGERRVVTLTKEGGIGKTAIALEVVDWLRERTSFPGGIFELACEHLATDQEFLTRLLTLFGLPPDQHKGDLLALFSIVLSQAIPDGRPALLVLDNLDDLCGQHVAPEVRHRVTHLLETALTIVPTLRILATCRWPLDLADHELPLEVPPMHEDEARDVFISHVDEPAHCLEARQTWSQPESPIRQLIRMSGRHPQSLRLLARQMGRRGMTLAALRDEAHADLLAVLQEPLVNDSDQDRLKKVQVSYELSYRHLSEEGKRLFARLCRLPGGIWCGDLPEHWLDWHALLGDNWRTVLEKELDYFALVHYEPSGESDDTGAFAMLPPMLEFARQKYASGDQHDWESTWIDFWQQHIGAWNQLLSGRLPDNVDIPEDQRSAMGAARRQLATVLFEHTQQNWLAVFEYLVHTDGSAAKSLLLGLVSFCQLTGQLVLLRHLSQQAVEFLRTCNAEEDLAACLGTLGNRHRALGDWEAVRDAYTEALAIYRRLARQHPAAFDAYVATTLNNLGNMLRDLGEREAARDACTEALVIYRRLAQQHPTAFDAKMATTLNNLGNVLADLGEQPAARDAYREVLAIYRRLAQQHPTAFDSAVAATLNNLGNVLGDVGAREAARDAFTEALVIRRRLAQQHPAAFDPDVATTLNNLGNVLCDLDERAPAREAYTEALAIRRRLAQQYPAAFNPTVATTLHNLGIVLRDLGERAAAREAYTEALEIYMPLFRQWPQAFEYNFLTMLWNYINLSEEDTNDPWWQLWKQLQEGAGTAGEGETPTP
jgi:tetratricopeptide (TPR) repeat protein